MTLSRIGALLALSLGACASARPADSAAGVRPVPLAQLPERHREALAAYGAGGEAWERARAEVRADPELGRFVIENLVLEMVRAHDALALPDGARARRALDRSRAELVRLAPESVPTLVELVALGDDVVAVQAGSVLAAIELSEARAAARVGELLDDPQARTRRRAAHLLAELASAGPEEAALQGRLAALALGDAEWSVRAESARALGIRASAGRESAAARAALERALGDADATVAAWAAEGLGALEDPRAVPALIVALERAARGGDLALLAAAERALARASGERTPRDLAGWRRWWSDHRDSFERAR